MNLVDVIVVVAVIGYAFSGYRNGALIGALSVGGFLLGAVVGGRLAQPISTRLAHGSAQIPVAVLVVVFTALAVQALGVAIAYRLRRRITWRPARALDQTFGAALSAIGVLIVVWMLALPLASSPFVGMSRAIRESSVIHGVDDVMPGPVRSAYSSLRDLADRDGFPQVFGELQASHIRDVAPPDSALSGSVAVTRARASIVKVLAGDGGCGHDSEGSGFVYAPGRVLTNAHVVAGMQKVTVQDDGDRPARVVLFDPDVDLAVLSVDGLTGAPLTFATATAASGASAIVAGYPEDGPFDAEPARIRDAERAYGKNIYGDNERWSPGGPRHLLGSGPGAPGQLRRPAPRRGRAGARRRLRHGGGCVRHRLRPHRRGGLLRRHGRAPGHGRGQHAGLRQRVTGAMTQAQSRRARHGGKPGKDTEPTPLR